MDHFARSQFRTASRDYRVIRLIDMVNDQFASLAAAVAGAEKALDWYSRNPTKVRYSGSHWYSGYEDARSLNPDKWSSTGQWNTIREAVDAAIRDMTPR